MCEFVSWLEYKGKILFLTDKDLLSRRGKELVKYSADKEDWRGHGAICWFYNIKRSDTVQRECENFSSPKNFPAEISEAIKSGNMTLFGAQPEKLLTEKAWEQYKAITGQALEQYEAITGPAWEQYKAITGQALEQYEAITGQALEQYEAIKGPAWEQYEAITGPAWEQYKAITGQALEQYEAITGPAWEQYEAITGPAWEQYEAITGQAFWELFAEKANRATNWK